MYSFIFFNLNLPCLFISVLLVVGYSCLHSKRDGAVTNSDDLCVWSDTKEFVHTSWFCIPYREIQKSWLMIPVSMSDWELFPLCFVVLWSYWWSNPFWCMAVVLLSISCTWDDFIISYPRWVKGGVIGRYVVFKYSRMLRWFSKVSSDDMLYLRYSGVLRWFNKVSSDDMLI